MCFWHISNEETEAGYFSCMLQAWFICWGSFKQATEVVSIHGTLWKTSCQAIAVVWTNGKFGLKAQVWETMPPVAVFD